MGFLWPEISRRSQRSSGRVRCGGLSSAEESGPAWLVFEMSLYSSPSFPVPYTTVVVARKADQPSPCSFAILDLLHGFSLYNEWILYATGIAQFTILTASEVTAGDISTNFFLLPESLGGSLAEEAVR